MTEGRNLAARHPGAPRSLALTGKPIRFELSHQVGGVSSMIAVSPPPPLVYQRVEVANNALTSFSNGTIWRHQ